MQRKINIVVSSTIDVLVFWSLYLENFCGLAIMKLLEKVIINKMSHFLIKKKLFYIIHFLFIIHTSLIGTILQQIDRPIVGRLQLVEDIKRHCTYDGRNNCDCENILQGLPKHYVAFLALVLN